MSTIKLKHPVTVDGVEVGSLTIRRPKVRDMLSVEKGEGVQADKEIRLFANLCEVTPVTIQELDMADYANLQKAYQDFLS